MDANMSTVKTFYTIEEYRKLEADYIKLQISMQRLLTFYLEIEEALSKTFSVTDNFKPSRATIEVMRITKSDYDSLIAARNVIKKFNDLST